MANQRNPKRQRKKEAALQRRLAMIEERHRQRRQRRMLMLATAAGLVVVGAGAIFFTTVIGKPKPSPSPGATPKVAPSPAPIACGAKLPPQAGVPKPTFAKADDQKLDKKKTYIWRLDTSCGRIDVKLALGTSPKTVNSIVFLTKKGFYDGLTFHRVVKDFVIQGGDPKGDGSGGPGYSVADPPPAGTKYTKGLVAMAKTPSDPPGTSGSQFFVVSGSGASVLTADYAVLGPVSAGLDVVDKIAGFAPAGDGPPTAKVFIEKATVVEQ